VCDKILGMIEENATSPVAEIARILALGILRMRAAKNNAEPSQKPVDFRANGSIHGRKENGRE
jgi:hypothetical protein